MTVKLEALLCSGKMLRIFEVNGTKNYLGFARIDEKFTEQDMKYIAVMLYSKTSRDLKRAPKVEVEVIYQNDQ